MLNLSYSTPFRSAFTTGTILSTFPEILGTSGKAESLTGVAYQSMQSVNESLQRAGKGVDQVLANSSQSDNYTTTIINQANKTSSDLFQSLLTANNMADSYSLP